MAREGTQETFTKDVCTGETMKRADEILNDLANEACNILIDYEGAGLNTTEYFEARDKAQAALCEDLLEIVGKTDVPKWKLKAELRREIKAYFGQTKTKQAGEWEGKPMYESHLEQTGENDEK